MSSTISGTYELVESLIDSLHATARKKISQLRSQLDRINDEAARERAEYEKKVAERNASEDQRRNRENDITEDVAYQEWLKNGQQAAQEKGIALQLKGTIDFLRQQEDHSTVITELISKLRQYQATIDLFGTNEQVETDIKELIETTIPEELEKERQADLEEHLERQHVEAFSAISGNNNAKAPTFVSLADIAQSQVTHDKSPWELFSERLMHVLTMQHSMGIYDADELAEQASTLPVSAQNRFIVQNEAHVVEWEEELNSIAATQQAEQEQIQETFSEYNALCQVCNVPADQRLTIQTDLITLRHASAELWKQLETLQERAYIESSFREVFEKNGMAFESMSMASQNTVQLEFAIDERASVRLFRTASGAFEMRFVGKSSNTEVSQNERREIMEKATSFCSLLPKLTEELAMRGIIFDQRSVQEPHESSIILESSGNNDRFADEQTEKTMTMN